MTDSLSIKRFTSHHYLQRKTTGGRKRRICYQRHDDGINLTEKDAPTHQLISNFGDINGSHLCDDVISDQENQPQNDDNKGENMSRQCCATNIRCVKVNGNIASNIPNRHRSRPLMTALSPRKRSYRNALLMGLGIFFFLNEYYWRPELRASPDLFLKDDSPTNEATTMRADIVEGDSPHQQHHPDDGSNPVSRQRIVVSLKMMPSRIRYIESTLTSLLTHQTMPLDKLYLVLPHTHWVLERGTPTNYEIPGFLKNLTHTDDRFEILKPDYDYGPVDKMIFALTREAEMSSSMTNLIYVDDDVIYHQDLVRILVTKGREYPDSLVALSGCTLRSQFRQIKHQFPRDRYDQHPNLYYRLSGTASLPRDEVVDIVQGFAGVLVRPAFFEVAEFWEFVMNETLEDNIWRSDDYIISAYLEHRNITKWLVAGEAVHTIHKQAATQDNLGTGMHRNAMQAAYQLRSTLGVWSTFHFEDYRSLEEHWRDLIDCEAGHKSYCKKAATCAALDAYSTNYSHCNATQQQPPGGGKLRALNRGEATVLLDAYLLASSSPPG